MKATFYFTLILAVILGCNEKTSEECNLDDPMEMEWLQDLKSSFTNCTCEISIFEATFQQETVYYTSLTDPICNSSFEITLFDCHGNVVKEYQDNQELFYQEVEGQKKLYTCSS